ncbi:MAG: bifunctional phosphoglucose/phosphomannose isomerase [Dehalococcoidia bacterium]|jgi:glucose/mannose-6-phosphate isomerase|nr:bifunctional phosphoglucose/phosphomannose isomerase [Dehalococcoidia bacterium]MDP6510979.1 bifunctional phosphoglucose/phosphomannose isomerase [Dehalococcoidia bacterium]MDP6783348.1 bifunctional phosphoglucose/phosphomannose isomerase [Dehalococcoidia bacterium]
MADLDSTNAIETLDPSGMRRHLSGIPAQCRRAWQRALDMKLPDSYSAVSRIVVAGMGGSAIGGDLVAALARLEGKSLQVHRGYAPLPPVDDTILVILSSYSGMTEETLSCMDSIIDSPSPKVIATGGGRLAEIASDRGIPMFPIEYSAPPRAVIGYSFFGLLGLLYRLSFMADCTAAVEDALALMESLVDRFKESQPTASNPAKQLAQKLVGKLPVIYGAGFMNPVARRWKTQVNENSKSWAMFDTLPELNHNTVVGYPNPTSVTQGSLVVLLSSPLLHPRILLRYRVTREILEREGIAHQELQGEGEGPLAQMASLIVWGDYVSYYLALLYCVDPTPVETIDYLKDRLARYGLPA